MVLSADRSTGFCSLALSAWLIVTASSSLQAGFPLVAIVYLIVEIS
jgi:hypothetical protein